MNDRVAHANESRTGQRTSGTGLRPRAQKTGARSGEHRRKSLAIGEVFPSCSLLLEYQTQHESTPNFIGDIGVEALSYQGQNFSTESKKLDKFCPFGGFGETGAIWPEFS
jgi:hypothetical protein